ncbi:Protein of unknown function [Pyronema omphalodes CBS 100304]|uniref:Uncharacterized protein n=1 Tax=Pyronema omphalodes (strain CBS 100304) TaxID=1076935 RepID=U4LF39_PYROM|nr:Protein of unknown function [Pyronema omphalodes CBS 100304]
MSQLLRESSPGPGERGYAPVLLDVIIGAVRYKVRSKSDLVEALEKRESQPETPTVIVCSSEELPQDILWYIYGSFAPQLLNFGVYLPGCIKATLFDRISSRAVS